VIEFANGTLETAKKPIIKPPKPAAPKKEQSAAATAAGPGAEVASNADANTPAAPLTEAQPEGEISTNPSQEQASVETPASAAAPEQERPEPSNTDSEAASSSNEPRSEVPAAPVESPS
jgi:hypothetical protein